MNDQTSLPQTDSTTPIATPTNPPHAVRNPKSTRVRNGKIARLPMELRQSVSECLSRGDTHDQIAKELNEDGYPEITRQNIGAWARGGHLDWLKAQQTLDSITLKTDVLKSQLYLDPRHSLNVNKLNNLMLGSRMNQIIELLDPKDLARLVAADPDLFFRFIKEEFNRQKQERELEFELEDRKKERLQREMADRQYRIMLMPEAERAAAVASLKAENDRLLKTFEGESQKQQNDQN